MDLHAILTELRQERDRLSGVIQSLESAKAERGAGASLPPIAPGIEWRDLRLPVHIQARLVQYYPRPTDLAGVSPDSLLKISHFGRKSLNELVKAIQARGSAPELAPQQRFTKTASESAEAARLARTIRQEPSAKDVRVADIRFGFMIRLLHPRAGDASAMADGVLKQIESLGTSAGLAERLDKIHKAIQSAKGLSLESEIAEFLGFLKTPRDRAILARVQGWDGQAGCALATAGTEFGITRERVRQIFSSAIGVLRGPQFAPALDSVMAFVGNRLDRPAVEVEAALQAEGLTGGTFRLEGILNAAELFERVPGFALWHVGGSRWVSRNGSSEIGQAILAAARRGMYQGAVRVSDLCADVSNTSGAKIGGSLVRGVLKTQKDFRLLDEAGNWFWLADFPGNALIHRLRKVLCVAPRIACSDLHAAISRGYRGQGPIPPQAVLLALCAQLPWCRVDGRVVAAVGKLDESEVLSNTEQILTQVLRRHGGVLPLRKFRAAALEAGVKEMSLRGAIQTSAVIQKHASKMYGLPPQYSEEVAGGCRLCEFPGCQNHAESKGVRNGRRRYRPFCERHRYLKIRAER